MCATHSNISYLTQRLKGFFYIYSSFTVSEYRPQVSSSKKLFWAKLIQVTHTNGLPNGCSTAMLPPSAAGRRKTMFDSLTTMLWNWLNAAFCEMVLIHLSSDKADVVIAWGKSKHQSHSGQFHSEVSHWDWQKLQCHPMSLRWFSRAGPVFAPWGCQYRYWR